MDSNALPDLATATAVRIEANGEFGTGFFVAPGLLLTCAHVLNGEDGPFRAVWGEEEAEAKLQHRIFDEHQDFPDLALLEINLKEFPAFKDHQCLDLERTASLKESVYARGYSLDRPLGDAVTGEIESYLPFQSAQNSREIIKFKDANVVGGMSGSALFNIRTGKVCGMVKRTRDHFSNLGGIAISVDTILTHFPFLAPLADLMTATAPAHETAGLQELIDILSEAPGLLEKANPIFRRLVPGGSSQIFTWAQAVREASVIKPLSSDDPPVLDCFVQDIVSLAPTETQAKLQAWQESHSPCGVAAIPLEPIDLKVVIMRSPLKHHLFEARTWKWMPGSPMEETGGLAFGPKKLSECIKKVREYMPTFSDISSEDLPVHNLEIEFIIPREAMFEEFEVIPFAQPGSSLLADLAQQFDLTVRPIDYLVDANRHLFHEPFWNLPAGKTCPVCPVTSKAQQQLSLHKKAASKNTSALFVCPPDQSAAPFLDALLSAGMPNIVWLRKPTSASRMTRLKKALGDVRAKDFRNHALNLRRQGYGGVKGATDWEHMTIVCDRVDRIPEYVRKAYRKPTL